MITEVVCVGGRLGILLVPLGLAQVCLVEETCKYEIISVVQYFILKFGDILSL